MLDGLNQGVRTAGGLHGNAARFRSEVIFGPQLEKAFGVKVSRAEQLCFRPVPHERKAFGY
jgi:hypothetical protein